MVFKLSVDELSLTTIDVTVSTTFKKKDDLGYDFIQTAYRDLKLKHRCFRSRNLLRSLANKE